MIAPHQHTPKDNKTSGKYRKLANDLYYQGKVYDALESYNKSLCLAPIGSEHMTMAYSSRSIVYFEAQQYQQCLDNIKLARDSGYPQEKMAKLDNLEQRCIQQMESQPNITNDPWDFFKLSYPANEMIPFIANCLELREDAKYGRGIYTNQDLKPGDIIALEETPFKALNDDGRFIRCANCFKSNKMSLIPMDGCASAMFCSYSCLDYGKDKYMCATDEEFSIVPRIMLQALELFDGNLSKLKALIDKPELRKKTVFDFDMSDDRSCLMNQLISVNSLMKNKSSELLKRSIETHPILDRWNSRVDREVVKSIMRHFTDITVNGLGFDWWELKKEGNHMAPKSMICREVKIVGNGIFPFSSLFNHQCHHNAERFGVDNKLVIFVRFPIRKGQQVFINYGANFDADDLKTRRYTLKSSFGFKCTCKACDNDWQRASKLKRTDKSFEHPEEIIISVAAAKKELKRNCQYIDKNAIKFPNFEITRLFERNFYLLSAIGKMEPCMF